MLDTLRAMTTPGREEELLAQLHELLTLPSPTPAPPFKVESGGRPLTGIGLPALSTATGNASGRRRRRGSKRDQRDDGEPADDAQPTHHSCKKRGKTKQQTSTSLVTSVPDFDGYQWRKYGQKHIEGAMYPRTYHRCTRSAEQGCHAKRTVQRNDDDGKAVPEYTVVYMGQHTCTIHDSLEAPVILETTVAVPTAATTTSKTNKKPRQYNDDTANSFIPASADDSCSATTKATYTGILSPVISDNITWSSSSSSVDYMDDYCRGLVANVVESGIPTPAPALVASLQDMVDFTGPIRSPLHVPTSVSMIDHFHPQLFNEPIRHFSADFDLFLAS